MPDPTKKTNTTTPRQALSHSALLDICIEDVEAVKPTQPGQYLIWLTFGWDSFNEPNSAEIVNIFEHDGELFIQDRPQSGENFPVKKTSENTIFFHLSNAENSHHDENS